MISRPAVPWPSSSLRPIESRCWEKLWRFCVNCFPELRIVEQDRDGSVALLQVLRDRGEGRGGRREVVDQGVDLLLALGVGEQGGDGPLAGPHALVDLGEPGTGRSGWLRPASRSFPLPYFSSTSSLPTRPLPLSIFFRMALSEWSASLKLLPSSLLSGLSDVIAPRNPSPFSVRPRIALRDLAMAPRSVRRSPLPSRNFSRPGPGRGRDLAADRHLGLRRQASGELDVLVAEESPRLDRGPRALAEHRRPPPHDVVDDAAPSGRPGRPRG